MVELSPLLDALAQLDNPFAAAVVSERDVHTGAAGTPDVESIHQNARAALRRAVAQAGSGRAHALVITGEAGDGKSHLLAWLRRNDRHGPVAPDGRADFVFVSVPPLPDPGEPFRHTLRQVMAALRAPLDGGDFASHLDRLVWNILLTQARDLLDSAADGLYEGPASLPRLLATLCQDGDGGRQRDAAGFAAAALSVWPQVEAGLRDYMLGLPTEVPVTDLVVRTVLAQYPDPQRRPLCAAWLAGEELGEDALALLAVKQSLDSEAASRRVLTALSRLSPVPVMLCFDQIESITDRLREPGLRALAEVVRAVHLRGGATGQVITCLASLWPALLDKLSGSGDSAAGATSPARPDVLDGPQGATGKPGQPGHLSWIEEVALSRIEPQQVRDLVVARLAAAFSGGPQRPSVTYPFSEAEVLAASAQAGIGNAREALRYFEGEFERRRDALVSPDRAVNASTLPPPTTDAGVVEAALLAVLAQVHGSLGETRPGARASTLRAVLKELCDGLRLAPRRVPASPAVSATSLVASSVASPAPGPVGIQVLSCDPILGGGLRLTVQPMLAGVPKRQDQPPRPAQEPPPARVRAAFEIGNADVGPALFGAASRLGRQVSEGRAELALLLREESLPLGVGIAKAQLTQQTLEGQLGARGGILWLAAAEVAELLAAERVLHAASSGELSAGPRPGQQPISRGEAVQLLLGRAGGPPRALRRLLGRMVGQGDESSDESPEPGNAAADQDHFSGGL